MNPSLWINFFEVIYYRFITTVGPSEVRRSFLYHHSVAPNFSLAVGLLKALGQILIYSGGFIILVQM